MLPFILQLAWAGVPSGPRAKSKGRRQALLRTFQTNDLCITLITGAGGKIRSPARSPEPPLLRPALAVQLFDERDPQMLVGAPGGDTPARCALEEAQLQQEWLVDILDRVDLLG